MKFLKFVGWSVIGLLVISGLAYGLFPILASIMITQELTKRGFENIIVHLDYPGPHALIIQSLSFRTPVGSGSTSILIDKAELLYSLDSLLHTFVETVDIEHITMAWDSSLPESPSSPSPSLRAQQPDSEFVLSWLRSGATLPVLPFQHLRIRQLEISNPLASPGLQHISITATVNSLPGGYEGTIHLEGDGLPLNLLTFSLEENGIASLSGTHTNAPEDPILSLKTSLDPSSAPLMLKGQTTLKLHPLLQTFGALYPIPAEYQSLTGTFSSTWTGTLHKNSTQSGSNLGTIQGDFVLEANMPTWPPLAQDIQLRTQGIFSVDDHALNIVLQSSSSGTVSLSLDSVIPPTLKPFISHAGLRSVAWNVRQPVHVVIPLHQDFHVVRILTGQIPIAMRNSSEQLDILLSPHNLRWGPSSGVTGNADVIMTTHFQPASTPSFRFETLSLEVDASLMSSADHLAVKVNPTSFFHLSTIDNATLHIPALKGRFPKGLIWTYHPEQQTWEWQIAASNLSLPSLWLQGQQWELGEILSNDLVMTYTPERWVITGETEVKNVHTKMAAIQIPASTWQTRYSVDPTSVTVHFRGQTPRHPLHLAGQVGLDLLTSEGSGTISLKPVRFAPQTLALSQLIQPWPFLKMDVIHGTVSASADITFGKDPTIASKPFQLTRLHGIVDLKELGGFMSPTIMEGLTTHVEILGEHDTFRLSPTPLHIRHIQTAVDVTDTSFILSSGTFHQASVPTISATNLSTNLLGGTITVGKAIYDPSRLTHEVTLQVQGLDLGEILRLEQQETVKGTGTLDGVLPLVISGSEVEVHHGSLHARPTGGTLQMDLSEATAQSWTKSQPNLDLIVQSLQNFQYSKLEVGVDYEKTGILRLATRLEGKNPNYRKGVPIHFNLNIEENIPALMKSLSLIQDLEAHIKKLMTGTEKKSTKEKK